MPSLDAKQRVWLMPAGVFGGLSLLVTLPFLWPGFILTLDLVFTPQLPFPNEIKNTFVLEILLWLINQVVPGDIIEKSIIFSILFLSGIGMYRLILLLPAKLPLDYWRMAAYLAGLFYMINPFIYARFMAGQWLVLLGYALLPFFALALWRVLIRPSLRTSIGLTLWLVGIAMVSIHHGGIMAISLAVAVIIVVLCFRQQPKKWQKTVGCITASSFMALVVSSFWIIPSLLGNIGKAAASFNEAHFSGFATLNHGIGAIGHVLRFQGFWAEGQQLFVLPQQIVPLWGVLALLLWAVVVYGIVKVLRWQRWVAIGGISAGGIAIILAATPLIQLVSETVPLIGGYREPHKFSNILVLVVAGFFGVGGASLLYKWKNASPLPILMACLFLLPIMYTPTMFGGFMGQLKPRQYPADWATMNAYLTSQIKSERVLFLPWYQYMKFDFAGRTIANPADKYFDTSVIVSDNLAFKAIPPTIPDDEKAAIERALTSPNRLVKELRSHDIRYILLSYQQTEQDYTYLKTLPGVKAIRTSQTLTLYHLAGKGENNNR